MKKLIAILVIFFLIVGILIGGITKIIFNFCRQKGTANSQKEFKLPKVSLKSINDTKINFRQQRDPTILFFWLPQSESCRLQLNILTELNQNYTSLKFIGIGIGAVDSSKLKTIAQEKDIEFPVVIDRNTKLTRELNITTIPSLIFYRPTSTPKTVTGFKSKTNLKKLISSYFSL